MELTWEEIHDVLKTIVLYIVGNQDDDADLNHEDSVKFIRDLRSLWYD